MSNLIKNTHRTRPRCNGAEFTDKAAHPPKDMKDRKNNKPAVSQPDVLLRDQIELRAYHIWLAGGGGHGNDLQHWLQAEKEIVTHPSAEIADPRKS